MSERGWWWGALLAGWLVLCAPLLVVEVPPLVDYPNHLARMDVLAHLGDVPSYAAVYRTNWGMIPDLATDLFMPGLVRVVPVYVAGRLVLALILLLDVVGAAACAAALHGRRTWWSLGVVLVAYNYAFLMGFLNFELTMAAGMLLAAGWMAARRWAGWAAGAWGGLAAGVLFFGHLMGLGFFLMLCGSFEAGLMWARRGDGWRALAGAWPLAPAVGVAGALYLATGLRGAGGLLRWLEWEWVAAYALGSLLNVKLELDIATALLIAGFLLACLARRRLHVAPGAVAGLVGLAVLYPLTPNDLKGTSLVGVRLAVMFGFMVFIGFRPAPTRRAGAVAGAVLAGVFLVRMGLVGRDWWAFRQDVANVRAVLAPVQPGQFVAQIDISPDDAPDYDAKAPPGWLISTGMWTESHLGALAVLERQAYWPNMFVNPDQQPLVFRPAYEALAQSGVRLPSYSELRDSGGGRAEDNPFCAFDWVLVQGVWAVDKVAGLAPGWLALVGANRTAALYRVEGGRRCAVSPAWPGAVARRR